MIALPLALWLSAARPANTVVARQTCGDATGEVLDDTFGDIRLSQLRRDVALLHGRLCLQPQARWALCFNDSYQFCVALLAVLHGAKTPVLLGHHRPAQLREQSEHFDGVLTDLDLSLSCPVWTLPSSPILHEQDEPTAELPPIADSAFITLFTSGSTGEPSRVDKLVTVMDQEASWLAALWGSRLKGCVVRASVSHQHLYGLTFCIWLPLSLALPLIGNTVEFPEQLTDSSRYVFITSPAFLRRLDRQLLMPAAQLVISAGGPLPSASAALAAEKFGVAVDEIYGSTETGIMAWRSHVEPDTLWQAFTKVSFIADAQDRWWVSSPLITDPQGLALDDRLLFADSGGFTLGERRDRIVKIEEKRISLSDIERRLTALDDIVEAAVLTLQRGARQSIGAVVVLSEPAALVYQRHGRGALTQGLRKQLAAWLEPVALPRYWRVVNEIPLNPQSKRSWSQLQELFNEAH